MRLGPHTVTVVHPGTRADDYGTRAVADWTTATRTDIPGCSVQPSTGGEYTIDRDAVVTGWTAYLPHDTVVDAHDRVEWLGGTYEIVGDVTRWEFGGLAHLVISLRKSEG